ncbi:hypothetical protein SAMN02982990_01183 [Photorhabdus luminescens]|uniref:Uncharacterized protein n=2 Tax=Morganellaceae TaxID=1903414 RepID=A0A1G5QAG7_PHOLU|nr:hypothetical protein SAMN02982990_01183 [Photorhabdus luminescens]
MTDKEMNIINSLKTSFKSGVLPTPEEFSHLIDEAYKAYEIIDGAQGDGPTAGLKRDDKGKLALNVHHSGGLNLDQGALALSLKPEGGLSFDGGGYLKLDADRQIQFADFFRLSRRERMEIAQLLGLKRSTNTTITRIVSPSPKANEFFGASVSMSAAGDCLAVGVGDKVCVYTGRKNGWNTSTPVVFEAYGNRRRSSSWDISLNAAGDCLALGYKISSQKAEACVYMRTNGVWDTKNPVVFTIESTEEYFVVNVSLSGAGDCLVVGGDRYSFYMYTRVNGIWDRENPIKLSPPGAEGVSPTVCLSTSGNCLAVHGFDVSYPPDPAINTVYVYTRTNGIWDIENPIKLVPEDGVPLLNWVFNLNAKGDRLAVGADYYLPTKGKVYLYTRKNGIWDRKNPIKFSAPASGVTYFGNAIKLNDAGNRLAVGAASRVYVYTCLNGKWNMETPMEILNPSGDSDNLNGFGKAVGLNKAGTSLAVGATSESVDSKSKAGAVYVFENIK